MDQNILSGTLGMVIIVFLIVLFLLWFLLPFAVFGIKGRLNELIQQNEQIISLLKNNKIKEIDIEKSSKKRTELDSTIMQPPNENSVVTSKET